MKFGRAHQRPGYGRVYQTERKGRWFVTKSKKTRKTIGKSSRLRGQRGERIVAKAMSTWWGSEFARTPSSGGFKTKKFREEWNASSDLVTSDATFPFAVEVKNCEGWNLEQLLTAPKCDLYSWWKQTVGETPEDKTPLLVFTRNHQPLYCMMYETDANKGGLTKGTMRLTFPTEEQGAHGPFTAYVQVMLAEALFSTKKEAWL